MTIIRGSSLRMVSSTAIEVFSCVTELATCEDMASQARLPVESAEVVQIRRAPKNQSRRGASVGVCIACASILGQYSGSKAWLGLLRLLLLPPPSRRRLDRLHGSTAFRVGLRKNLTELRIGCDHLKFNSSSDPDTRHLAASSSSRTCHKRKFPGICCKCQHVLY